MNSLSIYYLFGGFTTNSQSFSRINYKFSFYFQNKQWIYFLFLENAMYFLPVSRIYSENTWRLANKLSFIIYFANSVWLYHLYREFTINPWIHYEFTMNLLPFSGFTTNSLSYSRINYQLTVWRIYYGNTSFLFTNEYIKNALSFTRSHYPIASLLWIHYFSREFIMNSVFVMRIHYLLR